MSDAAFDALEPFQWPWPRSAAGGRARFFADGTFFTKNRRAAFVATTPERPAAAADATYPLILNTGRLRDQWHTMTRTGKSPRLASHSPEPFVDVHPEDAERFALRDGGLACLATPWGSALLRVRVSSGQRPGELFMPMHWSDVNAADAVVGRLANPAADPVSGQPELKYAPARIAVYEPHWRGYLLTRERQLPERARYWAASAVPGGCVVELAGDAFPDDLTAWARRMMATRYGDGIVQLSDPARGIHRWGRLTQGRLAACLFVASAGASAAALPPRAWLIDLLARGTMPQEARESLLIGRSSLGSVDGGRTVCACCGVRSDALTAVIASGEAVTLQALGSLLKAGTNCGSCISELRELIAAHAAPATSDAA